MPWRVYRPGIVVGHSRTGEIDKIDGPYYFFKALQRLRRVLPSWLPAIGIEGGEINIVPVDYVAEAMDYIAHEPDLDGRAFHLTDPNPRMAAARWSTSSPRRPRRRRCVAARHRRDRAGDRRRCARRCSLLPGAKRVARPGAGRARHPAEVLTYLNYPTSFDSTKTQEVLAGSRHRGAAAGELRDAVWDYWERNLEPGPVQGPQLCRARSAARPC